LLDEGLFVASYKFALLLALADLSIEAGDDSGGALTIAAITRQYAERISEQFHVTVWVKERLLILRSV
jgi:hypothetical protein